MDTRLSEAIQNSNRLCIWGYEGCGKSTKTIGDFITRKELFLLACHSFEQLREKQQFVMQAHDLTEAEAPIIAKTKTNINEGYLTNPNNPSFVSPNAKVVLCSHFFVTKNYHNTIFKGVPVVMDEFRWEQVLVPSVGIVLLQASTKGDRIERYIKARYAQQDAQQLLADLRHAQDTGTFPSRSYTADWLNQTERIYFCSSEKLASTILSSLHFGTYTIPNHNDMTGMQFRVATERVNQGWFRKMADSAGWDSLAEQYDLIISDRAKHAKIKNHTVIQGSNSHRNKSTLVILSQVPQAAVQHIVSTLNAITGRQFGYDEIAALFYRDRLCQAVGRNLGNRGDGPAFVLASTTIWNSYLQPRYGGLDFPVGYTEWTERCPTFANSELDFLHEHFECAPGQYILNSVFRQHVQQHQISFRGKPIKPAHIRKVFPDAKYTNVRPAVKAIKGIRLR